MKGKNRQLVGGGIGFMIFFMILLGFVSPSLFPPNGVIPLHQTTQHDHLDTNHIWTRLAIHAGFPGSYNFQLFADDTVIRAFHHDGVWSSSNGKQWIRTDLTNIARGQAFLDYVKFKGFIYALGTFDGNIARFTQTTQVARTSDFRSWEIVADESDLPCRYFYHPFVFRDKLWIIGGEDATGKHSDAWVSTDAVSWTRIAGDLPFGKRSGQRFAAFRDSLYMLAQDVWMSPDGIHWRMLTPKIADGEIFGYSVEIYDNRIWLIGCNRNGRFRNEVLSSSDGITWKEQRAPWSPRGGVATCVFKDQIIMTGGKYGGPGINGQTEFVYSNDVWSLAKR